MLAGDCRDRAYAALMEASKHQSDSWRIWDNLLAVATDIGELDTAIVAYKRMLDLKGQFVDMQVCFSTTV